MRATVDADVLELLQQERVLEAAHLSSARGDAQGASALFERACDWRSAAAEALRCGEKVRAFDLAVRAGDNSLAGACATEVARDMTLTRAAAARLTLRGEHGWAATVLESAGQLAEAACAWERAGDLTHAAELFERAGDPARAARALEILLGRSPSANEAALRLGSLLVRFRKDEQGVRRLQRVPRDAPQRREALRYLISALKRLGFASAACEAATELAELGGAAASPELPQVESALLARYEIVCQVASSPRARLVEATDRATGERVALKHFGRWQEGASSKERLDRFAADLKSLQALNDPTIVPIRDFDPRGPTVVLDWMAGANLERMLARGPVAPARAAEIACSILTALDAAHRLGVLHGGIKATNVLFDSMGAARLTDFGESGFADASTTVTAGDLGALGSMSPEQREGKTLTARSDIFGVGVLLHEMLTGDRPGSAPHRRRPSDANRALGPSHDAIVQRMTAYDANARPADALEARELLQSVPWPPAPAGAAKAHEPTMGDVAALARLAEREGQMIDLWTGRRIELVCLSDANLSRARAFANAEHPGLQRVLRVDHERQVLWLAWPGDPLTRPLTSAERRRLADALTAAGRAGDASADLSSARIHLDCQGEVQLGF
jgi:hypothetical protein